MLSRSRRRLPLTKTWVAKPVFLDLPDDILILVSSQCRIDEVLALRLVHSKLRNLIDRYITYIAPSVARSTFPLNNHLLKPPEDPAKYSLQWLTGLVPRHLAAILVDRHRVADEWTQSRYGIPAEDPFGDELRARVINGWRVLQRLSNIAQELNDLYTKGAPCSRTDIANKLLRPSRFKLDTLLQREDRILENSLQYIEMMPEQHAKDFKLTIALLSATFSTSISNIGSTYEPWIFDWGEGIDGQRSFRKGQTWLVWFVLTQGPKMFWQQWWALPSNSSQNYIRDLAIATFREVPVAVADRQRSHARTFQQAITKKADIEGDFDGSNPFRYFSKYRRYKTQREIEDGHVYLVKDVLADVPFRVNFRCPQELVERTTLLFDSPIAVRREQAFI